MHASIDTIDRVYYYGMTICLDCVLGVGVVVGEGAWRFCISRLLIFFPLYGHWRDQCLQCPFRNSLAIFQSAKCTCTVKKGHGQSPAAAISDPVQTCAPLDCPTSESVYSLSATIPPAACSPVGSKSNWRHRVQSTLNCTCPVLLQP